MGNIRFAIKDEVENLQSAAIKCCKFRIVTGMDLQTSRNFKDA